MKYIVALIFTSLCVPTKNVSIVHSTQQESLTLSKENIVKLMNDFNIQHVDVVLAQAILESGNFKSTLFKSKNNMFGMKVPKKRETTAVNDRKYMGYATYNSWVDCVKDYKLYQDYITKNKNISKSAYLSIIAKSYSETPDYVKKLHKIMSQNKKYT